MRVDVDGNQVILVFVKGDLEWVEDEADVGFLEAVEGNEFLLKLLTKHVFGGVEGGAHSDLEGTGTNNSSAFKAGVLACWLDHEQSHARDSQSSDIATLFEPTSLFRPVFWDGHVALGPEKADMAHHGREQRQHQTEAHEQRERAFVLSLPAREVFSTVVGIQ